MPTRKRNKGQETSLSNAIRNLLTAHGCWVTRIQTGIIPALYGTTKRFIHCAEPGTPDMMIFYPETAAKQAAGLPRMAVGFLEIKTKTGKLSKEQIAWHSKAAARGIRAGVARGLSEAIAVVSGWQKLNERKVVA